VSGTGQLTGLLAEIFGQVLTVDISEQRPADAHTDLGSPIRAAAGALPIAQDPGRRGVYRPVPYPAEICRVLRPDGVLLWINQPGLDNPMFPDTPTLISASAGVGARWNPRPDGVDGLVLRRGWFPERKQHSLRRARLLGHRALQQRRMVWICSRSVSLVAECVDRLSWAARHAG